VVPTAAVQAGPEGSYAFLVRPDASVELRPVRVAAAWQGQALIEAGLAAGDRVVVDGQYKLRPGAHVIEAPKGGDKTAEAKPREATP
jgi:multidrug efflux system membrane fusion protein